MKQVYQLPLFLLFNVITFLGFSQPPTLFLDEELISSSEMNQPWGMAFISSDELLFTEKSGQLYRYVISTDTKSPISGLPVVAVTSQGGLLDVALHPGFANNKYVYLSYSRSGSGGYSLSIGRGILNGNQLTNFEEIFTALPFKSGGGHFGSRIAFDNEGHLIFSSSERQEAENAQLLSNHLGKVIRLNDDGSVPDDNPFVNVAGAMPEIYSYGHRNIQGLVVDKNSGKIYAHEHGPRGGDELNLVEAGKNYGWPEITFGIDYDGSIISEDTAREGMEQPIRYWVPSIAPCGMAIVPVENEEEGEVNFILGALAGRQIQWVNIKNDQHVATYPFMQGYARFRDVEVSPDGKIYALTEQSNSLIRLATNQVITGTQIAEGPNSLQLYPNPATQLVHLNAEELNSQIIEISIYSGHGKLIRHVSKDGYAGHSGIVDINTGDLSPGIYLIEIKTEDKTETLRFQKI